MNVIIRKEEASDVEAISEVTRKAFENLTISEHTEEFIIHALRAAEALAVSLVAEVDGKVPGDVFLWAIPGITSVSDSGTFRNWSSKASRSSTFLPCRSMKKGPGALWCFTKVFRRKADPFLASEAGEAFDVFVM